MKKGDKQSVVETERRTARVWLTEVCGGDYLDAEYNYKGPDWTIDAEGFYHHPKITGKRDEAGAVAIQLNWMQLGFAETMARSRAEFMKWVSERKPAEVKRVNVNYYEAGAHEELIDQEG